MPDGGSDFALIGEKNERGKATQTAICSTIECTVPRMATISERSSREACVVTNLKVRHEIRVTDVPGRSLLWYELANEALTRLWSTSAAGYSLPMVFSDDVVRIRTTKVFPWERGLFSELPLF